MIEGRYVKNGEVTEVFLPNGLTQLIVEGTKPIEIQAFTFPPRRKVRKKSKLQEVAILSLIIPLIPAMAMLFGYNLCLCIGLFSAGIVWDSILMYANIGEKNSG